MSSQKQIDANRANGALSGGPKTPAGKFRSSQNATRHGLFSSLLVLHNESLEKFQSLADQYIHKFRPEDEVELGLVEEMISAAWRMQRSYVIETQQLESGMEGVNHGSEYRKISNSFGTQGSSPNPGLVHQYQARLQRMKSRALRDLQLLRGLAKNKNSEGEANSHKSPSPSNRYAESSQEADPANSFISDPPNPIEPNF